MIAARRAGLLLLASAGLAWAAPLPAQSAGAGAALGGRVVAAAGSEPVSFTVLVLLPTGGGPERTALTGADGSFHFDSIAAGEYRLRLDRVGFAPELGPPLRVTSARPETLLVRSAPRRGPAPAPLPADTACRQVSELPHVPGVAELWRDAATAGEARRLFDRAYRFTVVRRELDWLVAGPNRVRASVVEEPLTHTPADAFVEELRASAPESVWGQATGGLKILVPDLPQLFAQGFLATRCLTAASGVVGEYRLRLVSRTPAPPGVVRVDAALVLDSTGALTRVELEYRLDGRLLARGTQQYTDAGVPGGQLRFASRLDLDEVPRLAGTSHWVTRHHYDNYRIVRDTAR